MPQIKTKIHTIVWIFIGPKISMAHSLIISIKSRWDEFQLRNQLSSPGSPGFLNHYNFLKSHFLFRFFGYLYRFEFAFIFFQIIL